MFLPSGSGLLPPAFSFSTAATALMSSTSITSSLSPHSLLRWSAGGWRINDGDNGCYRGTYNFLWSQVSCPRSVSDSSFCWFFLLWIIGVAEFNHRNISFFILRLEKSEILCWSKGRAIIWFWIALYRWLRIESSGYMLVQFLVILLFLSPLCFVQSL